MYLRCFSNNELLEYADGDPEDCGEIGVGINSLSNQINQFKSFPNPAKTPITFELPEIQKDRLLQFKDIFGKLITELHLKQGQSLLIWDCSGVPSGVYFYQTEIGGVVYRGKIVVQH